MSENIRQVNIKDQHDKDYIGYIIYVARRRALPSPIDGLKPVHRRILYTMFHDFHLYPSGGTRKTQQIIGTVIGKYHPHGDAGVKDAIKPMVNNFEINLPLIIGQGKFGSLYGDDQSAPRYTEIKLSDYAMDCVISELAETKTAVDWMPTYDNSDLEPEYLPASVPNLLINGSFAIAVGLSTSVPKHNLKDVIDETLAVMHDHNHIVYLIPDNCSGSDIIATDFHKICNTGKGKYKVRGKLEICEYKGYPALKVLSMPDLTYFDAVKTQLEKLVETNVLPQIHNILNNTHLDKKTRHEVFELYIVLKKGSDANYVRDMIYSTTKMQDTVSVNFEVIYNETPVLLNYTDYIKLFLQLRREAKFRMYNNKLQDAKTKFDEMELYLKAMKSGDIDKVLQKFRKEKSIDRQKYIDLLVSKLSVNPIQANFLLSLSSMKLSMGYYNFYLEKKNEFEKQIKEYMIKLTDLSVVDKEIEAELIAFRDKYGTPRKSRIISEDEASGIPEGEFKIVVTNTNHIKKIPLTDKIGSLGGAKAKFVVPVQNKDNLIIFGALGKVFKYPVHRIPFTPKGTPGVLINTLIKYMTDDVCSVITESIIESITKEKGLKHFLYTISEGGLFKKMDLADFITVPPSGIIYSKLDQGDKIKDIMIMPEEFDLLIYSGNKVLRLSGMDAPYVKRSTKGNKAMNTSKGVDGFVCIYPKSTDVLVVTESGRINRLSNKSIPRSNRARAGASIIKLGKTDRIINIIVCNKKDQMLIVTNQGIQTYNVSDIQEGSTISAGIKIAPSGIIDARIVEKE